MEGDHRVDSHCAEKADLKGHAILVVRSARRQVSSFSARRDRSKTEFVLHRHYTLPGLLSAAVGSLFVAPLDPIVAVSPSGAGVEGWRGLSRLVLGTPQYASSGADRHPGSSQVSGNTPFQFAGVDRPKPPPVTGTGSTCQAQRGPRTCWEPVQHCPQTRAESVRHVSPPNSGGRIPDAVNVFGARLGKLSSQRNREKPAV